VVPDSEAVEAICYIAERLKVITEPAAAVTLAAAERLRSKFDEGSNVVLILCGGNVSVSDLCSYL
jgi:threonine dehydratase